MKKLFLLLLLSTSLVAQVCRPGAYCEQGQRKETGHYQQLSGALASSPFIPPVFQWAAMPQNWVDPAQCDPPGGVYDAVKTIKVSGGTYPATQTGFQQALTDWGNPTTGNVSWHVIVDAGVVIDCTVMSGTACINMPAKFVGGAPTTKCIVFESSNPLPSGRIACSWGLPGFGGTRNPGCDGHTIGGIQNDRAQMYELLIDISNSSAGNAGIQGIDDTAQTWGLNYPNHIVFRDIEITIAPGLYQSHGSTKPTQPFKVRDLYPPSVIGLERYYIHGWDPGDPGQPTTTAGVHIPAGQIGAGACVAWQFTSQVDISGTAVTWRSGKRFGMTLSAGAQVSINNGGVANNTVASHDILGTDKDTAFTLGTSAGTLTNAQLIWANPPAKWNKGCGDDIQNGISWNCDNCWLMDGYVEKIHQIGAEDHAMLTGFSNGPTKIVNNWMEGGACTYFSGGGAVDGGSPGPTNDGEIRKNYFGRDESYRQISAGASNSPAPPFGCGPVDHSSAHDTCPFNWTVKNSFELKLANRYLVDGNIIENSWPDGQSGYAVLMTDAVCSGGSVCGIFLNDGSPRTSIQNVHFSNNWIRNTANPIQLKNRAGGPGVGGGLATAVSNIDIYNSLITNIDDFEWGNNTAQTAMTDIVQWQAGSNFYLCQMSRASNVATAACNTSSLVQTAKWGTGVGYTTGNVVTNDGGIYVAANPHTSGTTNKPPTGSGWTNSCDPGGGSGTSPCWTRVQYPHYVLQFSATNPINIISRDASGLVTVSFAGVRMDPQNGGDVIIVGAPGWNGTFSINNVLFGSSNTTHGTGNTLCTSTNVPGTPNNLNTSASPITACERADGTFSDTFTYQDNTNAHTVGTLCSPASVTLPLTPGPTTCDNMPNAAVALPSLAYKATDIHVGDGVIASECLQPDYTHNDTLGYGTPSGTSVTAQTGTVSTGLTVKYASTGSPDVSGVVCNLENDAGTPKNMLWAQNTTLITNLRSIGGSSNTIESIGNYFYNNIWAVTGTNKADLRCDATGNAEGTGTGGVIGGSSPATCWDLSTLQWKGSVMQGRASASWPAVPLGSETNYFPANVTCAGATPDGTGPTNTTCVGFTGFMSGVSFPTAACSTTVGNQNNCPLMAAPWSTNVNLNSFKLVPSSWFTGKGVDTVQMNNAFTNTGYTCPTGVSCGPHGPYPD